MTDLLELLDESLVRHRDMPMISLGRSVTTYGEFSNLLATARANPTRDASSPQLIGLEGSSVGLLAGLIGCLRADIACAVGVSVLDLQPSARTLIRRGDVLISSSGTTGKPHWIVHTSDSLARSTMALLVAGSEPLPQRWFSSLPLDTIGGLNVAFRVFATGGELVLCTGSLLHQVSQLQNSHWDSWAVTPYFLKAVVRFFERDSMWQARPTVGLVGSGGSALDDGLASRAKDLLGAVVIDSYGSTETGGAVLIRDALGGPFNALPGVDVRGRANEAGLEELLVRVAPAARLQLDSKGGSPLVDADGFIATGDTCVIHDHGVDIVGRCSRYVTRGGKLISADELESALAETIEDSVLRVVGASSEGNQPVHVEIEVSTLRSPFDSLPPSVFVAGSDVPISWTGVDNIETTRSGKIVHRPE